MWRSVLVWPLVLGLAGCTLVDGVRSRLFGAAESPHDRYAAGLVEAGLDRTPLGRAWLDAAAGALTEARPIPLPHEEEGWLPVDSAGGIGLRFTAPGRRWVVVEARLQGADSARIFVDAYRPGRESADGPTLLAGSDSAGYLRFRLRASGPVILRVQPELLRGGVYRLSIGEEER